MFDKVKKHINIIKDTIGLPTFCVPPWINIAIRPNGNARLGCGFNISQDTNGTLNAGLVKSGYQSVIIRSSESYSFHDESLGTLHDGFKLFDGAAKCSISI